MCASSVEANSQSSPYLSGSESKDGSDSCKRRRVANLADRVIPELSGLNDGGGSSKRRKVTNLADRVSPGFSGLNENDTTGVKLLTREDIFLENLSRSERQRIESVFQYLRQTDICNGSIKEYLEKLKCIAASYESLLSDEKSQFDAFLNRIFPKDLLWDFEVLSNILEIIDASKFHTRFDATVTVKNICCKLNSIQKSAKFENLAYLALTIRNIGINKAIVLKGIGKEIVSRFAAKTLNVEDFCCLFSLERAFFGHVGYSEIKEIIHSIQDGTYARSSASFISATCNRFLLEDAIPADTLAKRKEKIKIFFEYLEKTEITMGNLDECFDHIEAVVNFFELFEATEVVKFDLLLNRIVISNFDRESKNLRRILVIINASMYHTRFNTRNNMEDIFTKFKERKKNITTDDLAYAALAVRNIGTKNELLDSIAKEIIDRAEADALVVEDSSCLSSLEEAFFGHTMYLKIKEIIEQERIKFLIDGVS